jgi:hypothetical protein
MTDTYDFSKVKLHLSTPCYGGMVSVEYMRSMCGLIDEFNKAGMQYVIQTISNDSLVTRARNCLLAAFLADESATHLMFIDADITFNHKSIYRLLAADKDVVGGIYPMKTVNWSNVREALAENPDITDDELVHKASKYVINVYSSEVDKSEVGRVEDGFAMVANVGTGFLLIKREVFLKLMEVYPEEKYMNDISAFKGRAEADHMWTFFDTWLHPETKRYLSEDYAFCQKWIQAGGHVWADLMCPLHHRGNFVFRGSAIDHFKNKIKPKK